MWNHSELLFVIFYSLLYPRFYFFFVKFILVLSFNTTFYINNGSIKNEIKNKKFQRLIKFKELRIFSNFLLIYINFYFTLYTYID